MIERKNNYELAARQAEALFLRHPQEALIRAFSLEADESHIRLSFLSNPYRIDRRTGAVERGPDWVRAGFEEVLSIFDCLCHSGRPPVLTGRWMLTGSLRRGAAGPANLDAPSRAAGLAAAIDRLPAACRALGGRVVPGGDFACELPVFQDFAVRLRLWLADVEFPAQLQFFWDENALSFVHYETLFYTMGHILARLEESLR